MLVAQLITIPKVAACCWQCCLLWRYAADETLTWFQSLGWRGVVVQWMSLVSHLLVLLYLACYSSPGVWKKTKLNKIILHRKNWGNITCIHGRFLFL